jgi:hypothetical protein
MAHVVIPCTRPSTPDVQITPSTPDTQPMTEVDREVMAAEMDIHEFGIPEVVPSPTGFNAIQMMVVLRTVEGEKKREEREDRVHNTLTGLCRAPTSTTK